MSYEKKKEKEREQEKEKEKNENDEEVALALVAECFVGGKKFRAGETWTDPKHECRMSICNPGGAISYLECPHFELEEGDEIRIPGESKYAYPHCCDYVFYSKKKKEKEEGEEGIDKEAKGEKDKDVKEGEKDGEAKEEERDEESKEGDRDDEAEKDDERGEELREKGVKGVEEDE